MDKHDLPFEGTKSERLLLRKAVAADFDAYVELCSDPEVRRYLGGPMSAERVCARLEVRGVASITAEAGSFIIAEPSTGEMLGTVSLERRSADRPGHVSESADELELSYLLRRKWWGQGVASEAASLLLRTTAEHLPDQVVLVVTQTANAPSLTLAECLGFQNVGTFVEFDAEQWLGAGQLHELARVSPRRLSLEDVDFQCPLP